MLEETIVVDASMVGVRIDKLLVEHFPDFSRSRIQGLLSDGMVLVNGNVSKANYKVRENDVITLQLEEDKELEVEAEDLPLDIIYEDHDLIVVNKAKGMVVHPSNGNQNGTLVNALLYHCKDLSGINGVLRPGIVHRIDKDTSGLLVVAKSDAAHQGLSEQLKDKSMYRRYVALVHGVMEHDYGTIDAPIGRDAKDRQKMAVTSQNSKTALTHFKVMERFKKYTLVECRLETGRTHQIRVHMQFIKHPVVGDPKYSYRKTLECNGQMLHAYELHFVHPITSEKMSFTAPLPKEFEDLLTMIRNEEV